MKKLNISYYLQIILLSISVTFCSNNMDQLYLLQASTSAYPTGTPIDINGDGKVDGLDVNNDGLIDMRFVSPIGIPATGIDINKDGTADFYMYTTKSGSSFNMKADGTGSAVTVIIKNGQLIGYDTTGDGLVNINVTGSNVLYYKVGGNATGVTSNITLSLTINNSSYEYLTISANGAFQFTSNLNGGYFYQVAIASASQQCTFPNNNTSGIIAASDITNIDITCGSLSVPVTVVWDGDTVATPAPGPYPIGSMMLSLTINNSTTEYLSIAAYNGSLTSHSDATTTFLSKLNTGAFYKVLIVSSTDNCIISNNTGTMPIAATITVKCAKFTVNNSTALISGLTNIPSANSITLSLAVNGTFKETKTVTNPATAFTFVTNLFAGDAYSVQIVSSTQSCKISSNTGIISTTTPANITNVAVVCAQYTVGGTINPLPLTAALSSNMIVSLYVNGVLTESKLYLATTAAQTGFTFATNLYSSDIYNVQISTTQNCMISSNSGTIIATNISTVTIKCGEYTISGNIVLSGVATSGNITLNLQVISGSNVYTESITKTAVPAAPSSTPYGPFNWKLLPGDLYTVSVAVETIGGVNCTPAAGASGTISTITPTSVTTANINCP